MNREPDENRLLEDIFAEAIPPDVHVSVLGATLAAVQSKKRGRNVRRGALAGVAVVLGVCAAFLTLSRPSIPPSSLAHAVITTIPLPSTQIVQTTPLPVDQVVSSASSLATTITTVPGGYSIINDVELLALAEPRPAAIVRMNGTARLLFLDDTDAPGAPN